MGKNSKSLIKLVKKTFKLPLSIFKKYLFEITGVTQERQAYQLYIESLRETIKNWEQQHHESLSTINHLYAENTRWQEQHHLSGLEIAHIKSAHEEEIRKFKTGLFQKNDTSGNSELELTDLNNKLNFQQDLNEYWLKTINFLAQASEYFFNNKFQKMTLPLISIIMPVWNRADTIHIAIQSVLAQTYPHWELLIIDDGSMDATQHIIQSYLSDKRIHYLYQEHAGAGNARNTGLAHSKGEYIAYLDSDNSWYRFTLSLITYAFLSDPACKAVNFAEIWYNHLNNEKFIHFSEKFNHTCLIQGHKTSMRGIDLNCFAHHRNLYEQLGGFDNDLTRLIDYDLTYRYSKHTEIKALPFIGTDYHYCKAKNAISATKNCWYNLYRIRSKHVTQKIEAPLRVLYVTDHFPQVTESYIYTEMDYMQRQGVHIEVWSEAKPRTTYPTSTVIHEGSLIEAIRKVEPDLIHSHWLNAFTAVEMAKQLDLPMTIRSHGFEFTESLLKKVHDNTSILTIYLFPQYYSHFAKKFPKVKEIVTAFNPHRYFPGREKNKKMVLRVAPALPYKDLTRFFHVAKRCTNHRFVLVVGRCRYAARNNYAEELKEYNQSLGNPVDLRFDMMPEEIALLVQEAGIFLHTSSLPGDDELWTPIGMPISISESMATGAYVLARYFLPFREYIKDAGDFYKNDDEACELINATLNWTDDEWTMQQKKAIDRAFQYFVDDRVLPVILNDWQNIKSSRLKACG